MRLNNYETVNKWLLNTQFLSKNEIVDLQNTLFMGILDVAICTPFYKQLTNPKNKSINLYNFTEFFPVISKDTVRRKSSLFINPSIPRRHTTTINTSGTSGTPLSVCATKSSIQKNYAFFSRFLRWAGVDAFDRSATFAGRTIIPNRQRKPPYWRFNSATNTMLFSSYNISYETIPYYIDSLENVSPVFIDSYPSAIHEIASYIINNNIKHSIAPKCIITSSETLYDHQRDNIEKAFNCKVFDRYGNAEMAAFITQCEYGAYHNNPEYAYIEVLDNDLSPCKLGTPGNLVCTSFINPAMPLIRYNIGDTVALSNEECKCGRQFQIISTIEGRDDDIIIGCENQKVGRLDPIFKCISSHIAETQIIQTDRKNIIVRIACDEIYDKRNTQKILRELELRVGSCINIKVEYVDKIARSKNGKFRAVISLVADDLQP